MPIKLKLSLSSAQLASLSSSSSTPTPADKGKAKATPTPSSSIEASPNAYDSPSGSSTWDSPAPTAGPSRLPESSLGPAFSPYTPSTIKLAPPGKSTPKPKARSKVKTKFSRVTKHKAQPRAIQSSQSRPSAIPSHVYSGPATPLSSPGQMAPPPMPHYPFPSTTTPSPAPESRYSSGINSPNWEGDISVKEEDVDMDDEEDDKMSPDPISMPMTPGEGEVGTPNTRGRGVRWARTKKPLKEILGKIMIELRKRDEVSCLDKFKVSLSISSLHSTPSLPIQSISKSSQITQP
jgi:bromodomain-containing protein 7/9